MHISSELRPYYRLLSESIFYNVINRHTVESPIHAENHVCIIPVLAPTWTGSSHNSHEKYILSLLSRFCLCTLILPMIGYVISFYFLILVAFVNQALLCTFDMAGLTVIPQRITVAEMLLFIYLSCRVFCGDGFCYKLTRTLQYILCAYGFVTCTIYR